MAFTNSALFKPLNKALVGEEVFIQVQPEAFYDYSDFGAHSNVNAMNVSSNGSTLDIYVVGEMKNFLHLVWIWLNETSLSM